jgi:hypothetical protein
MSEATGWDELTRFEQRALIKLFGGGSLRNDDPAIAGELRTRGFPAMILSLLAAGLPYSTGISGG